jgi:anti-sigma B factor antagonist
MAMSLSDISEFANPLSATPGPESAPPLLHSAPTWTESEPEMIFSTTVFNDGSRAVVVLSGELDMATVGEFEQDLSKVEQSAESIVLDLKDLAFVDCSGLHSFISAQKRITAAGGHLAFIRGPRHIERLFTLTQVSSLFEFVEDGITA